MAKLRKSIYSALTFVIFNQNYKFKTMLFFKIKYIFLNIEVNRIKTIHSYALGTDNIQWFLRIHA